MDGFVLRIPEALCLGVSLTLSGVFYYLYKKSRKTVDKLDDAPHFTIDGTLKDILKVTPGACLKYAVIEGTVQPVNEPLTSQFQKEITGVLQRFMLREHRLVWNGLSNTWSDSERVVHQSVNTVPFVLVGSDESRVRVLCPLQASGVHMDITHEKFHQVNHSLVDVLGQYLSGEKLKGQLETEEMLKVGTALTGVGEVFLDTDGTLNLRPPSDGSEYFLSIVDFGSLREEQGGVASWWRTMAIVFGLAGAAVLLWVGRRYYQQLKTRWEREREAREFERLQAQYQRAGARLVGNAQDGPEDHAENGCVICLTRPRDCILLNCGHVCCCHRCFQALPNRKCPICRQDVVRVVPIYNI